MSAGNLDLALERLNQLIEEGREFPNAISRVLDLYHVDQDELTQAYDQQ